MRLDYDILNIQVSTTGAMRKYADWRMENKWWSYGENDGLVMEKTF